MKVQIWSDFVCPYCYAGKEQLNSAIKEMGGDIELEMMSYELAPGVEDDNTLIMADVLESKFGMSQADVEKNSVQVEAMIKKAGLKINSDTLKFSNTLKAHTLTQYFKEQGKGFEFASAVYNAYFVEGAFLNKDETLVEISKEFGISEEKVHEIISSEEYIAKVHQDHKLGKNSGVTSVPHVVIDGKLYLSGAQSKETYMQALKQAQAK